MKSKFHNAIVILLLGSCGGCIDPPSYPVEPEIEVLSISRTLINQLDTVRVEISFKDGDGDIGKINPDSADCNACYIDSCYLTDWNLYLIDNRKECLLQRYTIPYIPQKGSSDAISGKVDIVINKICCLYSDNTGCFSNPSVPLDTVIYSIQIKDRAGHLSNTIDLPPIVVRCI